MDWGYYCRTCGTSSEPIFDEPGALLRAYREGKAHGAREVDDDTMASATLNIQCLLFLVKHHDHDIWAECESGVLRLDLAALPYEGGGLPKRFSHS